MSNQINTVKTPNNSSAKTKDKWEEVNKLWRKVEKAEAKKANFQSERNAFYEQVKNQIGDLEVEYNRKTLAGLEKLVKFVPYKSLSDHKLDVLQDWIDNLTSHIHRNPFNCNEGSVNTAGLFKALDEQLKERFKKFNPDMDINFLASQENSRDAEINNLIIMLQVTIKQLHGFIPKFSKSQWLRLIVEPNRVYDILTDPFFNEDPDAIKDQNPDGTFTFNDDDFEQLNETDPEYQTNHFDEFFEGFSGFNFGSDDYFNNDLDTVPPSPLVNSEEINKIYRQLAHKFHPDKITNEDDKAHYSELMQKLSVAKKAKNIHVIIQMAIEYLPDFKPELSDETLADLVRSLKIRLREIDSELMDQQYDNSPQALIWNRFYHKSPKKVKENLNAHVIYLKTRISKLETLFFTEKMTIKRLNSILTDVEDALKSF